MNQAFTVEGLHVNYEKRVVLWDLQFTIPSGLMVAIVGPNGAGKSTLLKASLGLVPSLSGSISFLGRPLEEMRGEIAYVPQRASVDWDFPMTALELVLMGRYGQLGFWGRPRRADFEAAQRALDRVGMASYADRQIGQLSGGQQQRLFVARALVRNPKIFFMDEPFAGIDLTTEKELILLFQQQKAAGKTLFIVHHDLSSIEGVFDWVILLNTRLVAAGPVSEVFHRDHLAKTFGRSPALFEEVSSLSATHQSGWV